MSTSQSHSRSLCSMSRSSLIALVALALLSTPLLARAGTILYVSSYFNNTISAIAANGTVSTFATGLDGPSGLAFDSAGNLYATNEGNGTISKIHSRRHRQYLRHGAVRTSGLGLRQFEQPVRFRSGRHNQQDHPRRHRKHLRHGD